MSDRAIRLSIRLLSEAHWAELLIDAEGKCQGEATEARRAAVKMVLDDHLVAASDQAVSQVIEFLPEIIPYAPIPMERYSELGELLRNNVSFLPGNDNQ